MLWHQVYRTQTEDQSYLPDYFRKWRGLRVRVGLHYGQANIILDEVTKGYDYYGTVVNAASRIESVAHGAQVSLSPQRPLPPWPPHCPSPSSLACAPTVGFGPWPPSPSGLRPRSQSTAHGRPGQCARLPVLFNACAGAWTGVCFFSQNRRQLPHGRCRLAPADAK